MADLFKDIIENENFGRFFNVNHSFRSLISRSLSETFQNESPEQRSILANLLPKLRYEERGGKRGFFYEPSGMFIEQQAGQSLAQTLEAAAKSVARTGSIYTSSQEIFGPRSSIISSLGQRKFSDVIGKNGPYVNRRLESLAKRSGYTVIRQTVDTTAGIDIFELMGERNGIPLGFPIIDNEVTTIIQLRGKDGKFLDLEEISQIAGFDYDLQSGTMFKRAKAFINNRAIDITREITSATEDQRFKAITFDASKILRRSDEFQEMRSMIDSSFEIFSRTMGMSEDDFEEIVQKGEKIIGKKTKNGITITQELYDDVMMRNDTYNRMLDGMSFATQKLANKIAKSLEEELADLKEQIKNNILTPGQKQDIERHINQIQERINTLRNAAENGLGANIRLNNLLSLNTSEIIRHGKGDVLFTSEDISRLSDQSQKILRAIAKEAGYSSVEDMLKQDIDVFIPTVNIKNDFFVKSQSFIALEPYTEAKQAYVNILTSSSFGNLINPNDGDLINPDDFLSQSLSSKIKSEIASIENGIIPGGLRNLINDLSESIMDDLSPEEKVARLELQKYAREIKTFLDSGGDLSTNPSMMSKVLQIVKDENFAYRSGKYGSQIRMAGENVPLLGLKLPMSFSTRAQIVPNVLSIVKSQSGTELLRQSLRNDSELAELKLSLKGMMGVHSGFNRFEMHTYDIGRFYKAFGGFDLDDKLYSVYRYDSTAKRLLSLTFRDPNEVGEYAIFDANITMDKNFPTEIRALAQERQALQAKLASFSRGRSQVNTDQIIQKINSINDKLDKYFQGQPLIIDGKRLQLINTGDLTETQIANLSADEIQKRRIIKSIDITQQFSSDADEYRRTYAPSGFSRRSRAELEGLQRERNIFRSFSGEISLGQTQSDIAAQLSSDVGIFRTLERFRDPMTGELVNYNEYMRTGYFKDISSELESTISPSKSIVTKMVNRLKALYESRGLLGQTINQVSGVIDPLIQANENIDNLIALGLTEDEGREAIDYLRTLLQEDGGRFERVERETIIDILTKSGGEGQNRIRQMLATNYENLGTVMGKYAKYLHSKHGVSVGLDPYLFETRFDKNYAVATMNAYNQVVDEDMKIKDIQQLTMREGDPRSMASRLFGQVRSQQKELTDVTEPAIMKKTAENISEVLSGGNFVATQEEEKAARSVLTRYRQAMREFAEDQNMSLEEGYLRSKSVMDSVEGLSKAEAEEAFKNVSISRGLGFVNEQVEREFLEAVGRPGGPNANRVLLSMLQQLTEDAEAAGADVRSIFAIQNLQSTTDGVFSFGDRLSRSLMQFRTEGVLQRISEISETTAQLQGGINPGAPVNISQISSGPSPSSFLDQMMEEGYVKEFDTGTGGIEYRINREAMTGLDELSVQARILQGVMKSAEQEQLSQEQLDFVQSLRRDIQSIAKKQMKGAGPVDRSSLEMLNAFIGPVASGTKSDPLIQRLTGTGRERTAAEVQSRLQFILGIRSSQSSGPMNVGPSGTIRYASREIADDTSQAVIGTAAPKRKIAKFSEHFTELLKEPFFRKGLMIGGVFAAIGIGYGLTAGRTPEDIQGPPLLPGGSAYETYDANSAPNMSSIYSVASARGMNPGSLYKVNVTGVSDPEAFRAEIARITGSRTSSTIYNNRRTINQQSNSQDTLNRRLGL